MTVEIVGVELGILVGALLPPAAEDFDGAWVEVDRSPGGAGLAACLVLRSAGGPNRSQRS